jgi:hypothetical protein
MGPYVGVLLKHALSITNKKWALKLPAMKGIRNILLLLLDFA